MTNTIKQFLLWIAAVDKSVLERSTKKESEIRYISLGITILFIAIWAFISCSYAISQIFGKELNIIISIIVPIVYSLTILFIDRTIIASIGINITKTWIDKIKKCFLILLRILFASIIGLVISEPITIKIFDGEIKKRANEIKEQNLIQNFNLLNNSIDSLYRVTNGEKNYKQQMINNNNDQILKLQKKRYKVKTIIDEYGQEKQIIIEDKAIANLISELEDQNKRLKEDIQKLDKLYEENKSTAESIIKSKNELNEENYQLNQTLLSKHHLLWDIIIGNKKMLIIYFVIVLFFLMIDVLPVVTKTFFFNGEYEQIQLIDSNNNYFQEEINNIKNNYQKELTIIEQNYNKELTKTKNDYERKIFELNKNHNLEIEAMKLKTEKALFELSNKDSTFEKLKYDHQLNLQKLKNDSEYQILKEDFTFEKKVNELKNKQSLEQLITLLQNYNEHLNNNVIDNYIVDK